VLSVPTRGARVSRSLRFSTPVLPVKVIYRRRIREEVSWRTRPGGGGRARPPDAFSVWLRQPRKYVDLSEYESCFRGRRRGSKFEGYVLLLLVTRYFTYQNQNSEAYERHFLHVFLPGDGLLLVEADNGSARSLVKFLPPGRNLYRLSDLDC
jgi:hypothetical protein